MYLQRIKILRRQANWRSRSLSRHEQPKFAQLSNALRNASADRRQNPGVPVLCRWRMHLKGQGTGGRVSRAKQLKEHLSYGGRVALRRCPFFMPGTHPVCCLGSLGETKIEKTSKLKKTSYPIKLQLLFSCFILLYFCNVVHLCECIKR